MTEQRLPPVGTLAVVTLILVAISVIFLAAHVPHPAPRALPTALLAGSVALLLWNAVSLARLPEFAWDSFFQVFGWALLGYAVIAGMLEYAFVLDHTRGSQLALVTSALVLFTLDVPLLLAFGVARYQPVSRLTARG